MPSRLRPLAPHDGPSTATLTWSLPPTGGMGSYVYFLGELHDGSGDGNVTLRIRRATGVFEMWPA